MTAKNHLTPKEILKATNATGITKSNLPIFPMFILSIIAGAFIAFGAAASNMGSYNLLANPDSFGLGKVVAGAIFASGLIMVVCAGAELFTGNSLMTIALLNREITLGKLLRNWLTVYIGNAIGSIFIAFMIFYGDILTASNGLLGAIGIKIAVGKASLPFMKAFWLAVLCNWLVCTGVWMATGADSTIGKIFSAFFPIWAFVLGSFEHCVANMYYGPSALFAKTSPQICQAAVNLGLSPQAIDNLTWSNFFLNNLVPVTLGNIVGGAICVGMFYWLVYREKESN